MSVCHNGKTENMNFEKKVSGKVRLKLFYLLWLQQAIETRDNSHYLILKLTITMIKLFMCNRRKKPLSYYWCLLFCHQNIPNVTGAQNLVFCAIYCTTDGIFISITLGHKTTST
jgi:hypothetical protein